MLMTMADLFNAEQLLEIIEHYKHFHQLVFINGKKYNVILKIVKPVNQPHKFYYYSLIGIAN